MSAQLIPLLILALLIFASIIGAGVLIWCLCADSLDPNNLKRSTQGRRRSDQ